MTHPINTIIVDGVPVAKGPVRDYERRTLTASAPSDIPGLSLGGTLVVLIGTRIYGLDAADTTSAHDGDTVLVDADGRRFKRATASGDLTAPIINATLGVGGLALDRLTPGGIRTLVGQMTGTTVRAITTTELVQLIDNGLGNARWKTGVEDLSVGSLIASLPRNHRGNMVGGRNRAAIFQDGQIRVAGNGAHRLNGDPAGNITNMWRAVPMPTGVTPQKLYLGSGAGWVIGSDNHVYSWGSNGRGALGHGDTTNRTTPTRIEWFVSNSITISEIFPVLPADDDEAFGAFFLGTNGRLYFAGTSESGEDGQGGAIATNVRSTPVLVGGGHTDIVDVWVGPRPVSVFYRRTGGSILAWGRNVEGQLGIGSTTSQSTPQPVAAIAGATKIAINDRAALALVSGQLWSCGTNAQGHLGLGDTTNRTSFVQVTSLGTTVRDVAIATWGASVAIVEPSTGNFQIRTWGHNGGGECGLGNTTTPQTSPQTPSGTWQGTVLAIATGGDYSTGSTPLCATYVQSGNEIFAAGYNGLLNLTNGGNAAVSNAFTRVLGLGGAVISEWCVSGYANVYGLLVRTATGAFSGGANTLGELGIGGSRTDNSAVMQGIDVADSRAFFNTAAGDARYLQLASPYVDWTPAITPQAGAFGAPATVQVARYRLIGKTCIVQVYFTIVDNGTGSSWVNLTLPFNSRGNMMVSGASWSGLFQFVARVIGVSNVMILQLNGGGYIGGTGAILTLNFTYEVQ